MIPNFPHILRQGWFVALPILFTFVGMVMVAVGGFNCKMVKETKAGVAGYLYFGFTSVEVDGTCVKYTSYDPDPPLETGNAFAILATVFGALTVIAAILTTFIGHFGNVDFGVCRRWVCHHCYRGRVCQRSLQAKRVHLHARLHDVRDPGGNVVLDRSRECLPLREEVRAGW